jgi:hypothetical protein
VISYAVRKVPVPIHEQKYRTCQCLPGAFWPSLALLEKGVEPRAPLIALGNLILGPLEEVDKGRVGLEQVPRVLEEDAPHAHLLRPGQLRLPVQSRIKDNISVAYPECLTRIPDPDIFLSSRIPDPT